MRNVPRLAVAVVIGASALFHCLPVRAQTTDGYHSVQVFPIVVDSGSFVQRFNFHNNNAGPITLAPRYFPGSGTSQAGPLTCPSIVIPAQGEAVKTSLRDLCPALAAGGQFGFLFLGQTGPGYETFSAYSRVSNIAGAGFSVEGFASSTFTSAKSVVTGARRLAATINSPAYQTNCFVANINQLYNSGTPPTTTVYYAVLNSAGTQLGSGSVPLLPGALTRVLDVFSASGAPAGNHDDAVVTFEELGTDEPGLMTFCTVQDNTSFGADFRIAKMAVANVAEANSAPMPGAQDIFVSRDMVVGSDLLGRAFEINAGTSSNSHLVYYHQPDYVQCEIINPSTGLRALPSYGLEIRAVDRNSGTTTAGGNDSVVVPDLGKGDELLTGDKHESQDGANGRIVIEVEDNEQNSGSIRPYKLRCRSGSGMTLMDIIRYKEVIGRF